MTPEYANLKPWLSFDSGQPSQVPVIMKWTHSILQEENFVTECRAIEQARSLAFALGVYDGVHGLHPGEVSTSESRPCRPVRRLGFHPFTEILIGSVNDLKMHSNIVPESCLGNGRMPWAAGLLRGGEFSAIMKPTEVSKPSFSAVFSPEHIMSLLHVPVVAVPKGDPIQMKPNRQEDPQMLDPSDGSDGDRPPDRQRDPRRPPLRLFPAWVTQLWDLLQAEGAVEMAEEGPILYLQSFYISHQHHPHQHISRPLRIDRDYVEWERDFRFVWEDFVDENAPMDIHLVQPELPLPVTRGVAATVLLTQHPVPHQIACVVSAMYDDIPTTRRVESAHSLGHLTSARSFLWYAGALQACEEVQQQGYGFCTYQSWSF